MIYRITFGFRGAGVGWSETHAMLNGNNNPATLAPTLIDIAQKRALMLGREFEICAIRASRYATDAGVRARGVHLIKKIIKNPMQTADARAEPAEVAYLVRGSAEPSILNPQFDANQNQTFLGGPLDICVDNAGVVDEGKGGLGAAFTSWRTVMLNATMGWLANETIAQADIEDIAQNPSGTVTFTVNAADIAALTIGASYKIRVRGVNEGQSPLNIEMIVRKATNTTLVSRRVIGIPTQQTNGALRVYKIIQPFVDYGDLALAGDVGNHKRGRPFGSSPGRARRRILG